MKQNKLGNFVQNFRASVVKHSPEILTGVGIAGMLTSTALAVKATPKAVSLINARKEELGVEKLTVGETIKTTWKCYIPSAITTTTSVACLIGASSVHLKRNAMLATAYKISETALIEYKDKVIETIGEKKEKTIRDGLAKDRLEKIPVTNNNVIMTGNGETLCHDYYSGQYFKSDIDKIKKAVNEINRRIVTRFDHCASLNEYYNLIGLADNGIGDKVGWNIDMGSLEVYPSAGLDTNNNPCLVISFNKEPIYNYDKLI